MATLLEKATKTRRSGVSQPAFRRWIIPGRARVECNKLTWWIFERCGGYLPCSRILTRDEARTELQRAGILGADGRSTP